jgi:uncharacterized protein
MSSTRQIHFYDYFVDEHGSWFCEGNPVSDPLIFRILSRSMFQKGDRYFVTCEGEVHPVRVADAPLWVRYVHVQENSQGNPASVEIELQDGRREPLAADTLTVANERALYCTATDRSLKARFGKAAYYEITRYLQWEDETHTYYFVIDGKRYDITPER